MDKIPDISKVKEDELAELVGKKLGLDTANLKKKLESGGLDNMLKSFNPSTVRQIKQVLNDKAELEKMLNSPKTASMLKQFLK